MMYAEFKAIIADIEKRMDGEAYFIRVGTRSGRSFEGGWQWLERIREMDHYDIVVMSDNVAPPIYIPVEAIDVVELSDR